MSRTLAVEIRDEVFGTVERRAEAAGTSAARLAAISLEQQFGAAAPPRSEAEKEAARRRFESHFGEVDLGYPTGAANEDIDADLGGEYAATHEES